MNSFEIQAHIVACLMSDEVQGSGLGLRTVFPLQMLAEKQWEYIVALYMSGEFLYNPRTPRGVHLSHSETLTRMQEQMHRRFTDIITIFDALGSIIRLNRCTAPQTLNSEELCFCANDINYCTHPECRIRAGTQGIEQGNFICVTERFAYLHGLEHLIPSDSAMDDEEHLLLLTLRERMESLLEAMEAAEVRLRQLDGYIYELQMG